MKDSDDPHDLIDKLQQRASEFESLETDLSTTRRALIESERIYKALVEASPDAVTITDSKGIITHVSHKTLMLHGFDDPNELVGTNCVLLIAEEERERVVANFKKTIEEGVIRSARYTMLRKDNTRFSGELDASVILDDDSKPKAFIATIRDITRSKKAEMALHKSEVQYRELFDNASDLVYTHDIAGRFISVNNAALRLFGYTKEEAVRMSIEQVVAPDHLESARKAVMDKLKDGGSMTYEIDVVTKEGRRRTLEVSTQVITDNGNPVAIQGIGRDVTERKKADAALKESEARYRTLAEAATDGICIMDSGRFEYVNPALEKMTGYSAEEMTGSDFDFGELVHQDYKEQIENLLSVSAKGEGAHGMVSFRIMSREGRSRQIEVNSVPLEPGSKRVLAVIRDITDRELIRAQLFYAEKMAALGHMISGVAHELNNPMTGVLGYTQLLLRSEGLTKENHSALRRIENEANRARRIVYNLLTFARQERAERTRVQINELLGRVLEFRAYNMKVSNIEVISDLDPQIPLLSLDAHQIQHVFVNIVINAEQAMLEAHGKGRLQVRSRWDPDREIVRMDFTNDGPPLSEKELARIFDPFYTTKPVGKGTGLGLAVSYGILKEHGGRLIAESDGRKGATFTVELPAALPFEARPAQARVQAVPEERMSLAKKRILVVDDEPSVLGLVRRALEMHGAEVVTADSGEAALMEMAKETVDAVISDIKMPGMNGVEIFRTCEAKWPALARRFLFMTGDLAGEETGRFLEELKAPYVTKPFDLRELVDTIAGLLSKD